MRRLILLLTALPVTLFAQSPAGSTPDGAALTPRQLFEARRFDEARSAYQAQLQRNPKDVDALYHMGRIAAAQEKSGEAISWLEKAVKLEPTSALYHFWLGSALGDEAQKANKLRQPFLARRVKSEFERAVALDSMMLEPRQGLVNFYSIAPGIMGGSMDKAREQADAMVRINPMRGHFAHASIAQRQKDVAAEERAFQAALAAAPDSTQAHYSLGAFFRRQSRWADAFAVYERLMAAKPGEALAHAAWGITASQSNTELERGERELKYFLANKPADAQPQNVVAVHYRLGQIYEKTGRKELAREAYQEALRINPQHADTKKALDALK